MVKRFLNGMPVLLMSDVYEVIEGGISRWSSHQMAVSLIEGHELTPQLSSDTPMPMLSMADRRVLS